MINITHINDRCLRNGGAEMFLRELNPYFKEVRIRQSICVSPHVYDPKFAATFPFPVIIPWRAGDAKEMREAVDAGDVILCWGNTRLNDYNLKPKICIFNIAAERVDHMVNNCSKVITHLITANSRIYQKFSNFPRTLILPGVNPDRLRPTITRREMRRSLGLSNDQFVVGMVGRLDGQKRQVWLIECMRQLPNVKAIFVGEGPDEDKLRHGDPEQNRAAAPDNCIFVGHHDDIGNWYNCFDAFTLLSWTEGCPAVIYEAMFMSLPIVATPAGSVPETISNDTNGLIVEDVPQLIQTIIKLRDDKALRTRIGEAGALTAHAQGHIKDTAMAWENLILSLI